MGLTIDAAIAAFEPGLPLAVALSGGADSTALVLACAQKWPGQVRAVHVNHGLQLAADYFEWHCRHLCDSAQVPLAVRRIDARHRRGESPEDAGRRARAEALGDVITGEWAHWGVKDIALAQHADDQVETMLLALSRGAGLPGLAAMPAHWQRGGLNWHRPLLRVPAQELRQWLVARGQTWVQDPTNIDERFTRNRIRARLMPVLASAFPQFRDTFGRSARHAAQAQELLEELAAQDLEVAGNPPTLGLLQALSRARQANLLRHWLKTGHGQQPSAAQLDELLDQVAACTTRGHRIHIKVGTGYAQRQGPALVFEAAEA